MIEKIKFTGMLFQREGYVLSYCPELNVGSFGDTPEEAESSLSEAVSCFLKGCEELGTLEEVLEEAGTVFRAVGTGSVDPRTEPRKRER